MRRLLESYGIRVLTHDSGHHHARKGWLQMDCPHCSTAGKFRLGWRLAYRYFACWVCGRVDRAETLSALIQEPIKTCLRLLSQVEAEEPLTARTAQKRAKLVLPRRLGPLRNAHSRYLRGRGFDPNDLVRTWGIQGLGHDAEPGLEWRIFIPINLDGRTVSWTTRKLTDQGLRYRSAAEDQEAYPHKRLLYGQDLVPAGGSIAIHEGPTDVWATGPGAVCTFGISFLPEQVERLSRYSRRVLCFDSQPEAQKRANELADMLEAFPGETLNVQLDAKDMASASEREKRKFRKLLKG